MNMKKNNPFCGRNDGEKFEGLGNFDQNYKEIQIVDKVRKVGEGEDDYIIEKVVIESFKPIQEVIDADKDSVGVYNIIKQVLRTGDESLLPIDKGNGQVVDLTGAPENLMELKQMGVDAEKAFNGLPQELRGEMDMQSFVNSMTQEQFDKFIAAVQARVNPVKDGE